MILCCCTWKSAEPHPDCPHHSRRQFCEDCGEYLDPDSEGSCGECGWIPSHYDGDALPDVPSRKKNERPEGRS